jgi:protein-disulfide isomerase
MRKRSRAAGIAAAALGLGLVLSTARAEDAGVGLDKAEIEKIVRDYLLANPEILTEMQATLEAKQEEERRVAAQAVIKSAGPEIFASAEDGIVGNPEGRKTVVEFFDYNCGYCRHALSDMQAMTQADPDLRFVLKEFPILGPDSQKASVVSMAFRSLMPEKYAAFHQKLLAGPGRAGEASAIKVAVGLGADEAKLREAMKDPAIAADVEKTYNLADRLQISGTPSYVVGSEIVYGAMGQDVLNGKIADAIAACGGGATNC